jgi:hypothetical protein
MHTHYDSLTKVNQMTLNVWLTFAWNGLLAIRGADGYPGNYPHSVTRVAKSQTGTRESRSKAFHIATCMVLQLRIINALVIVSI